MSGFLVLTLDSGVMDGIKVAPINIEVAHG